MEGYPSLITDKQRPEPGKPWGAGREDGDGGGGGAEGEGEQRVLPEIHSIKQTPQLDCMHPKSAPRDCIIASSSVNVLTFNVNSMITHIFPCLKLICCSSADGVAGNAQK